MTISSDPLLIQSAAYTEGAQRGARYLQGLSARSVQGEPVPPGLDQELPRQGMEPQQVLALMDQLGAGSTVATAAGRYFGYVIGGALPAASGARAMLAAWDQVADVLTGPSVLKMEEVALRWVVDLLGLPSQTAGAFTSGATMANLTLLITARDTLLARQGHPRGRGLIGAPRLRIVASAEIHATVLKSLRMAGLGSDDICFVPVNDQGQMQLDQLPPLDASTIVIAQVGNVCTGAADPIGALAARCQAAGAWLHVDGAFGLWMRAGNSDMAAACAGLEQADSWVGDAHKTLNVPYDSGIALCRHPAELRASMAIGADYLPATNPGPADHAPEFSRSARGAETWAALLSLGRDGLRDLLMRMHRNARRVATELTALGFEVPHDVHFNQVFATWPQDETQAAAVVARVQASGEAWFGAASWQGRAGFRISLSNWATTDSDIDRLIAAIKSARP